MAELQAVEHEVLVPLDRPGAEKLDGRIRRLATQAGEQLVQVGRLLDAAKAGRIHEALGFKSWPAYVADALGGQLQLSGDVRQVVVGMLSGEGMSVRAIADATGVSKSTVARDIDQVSHNGTPGCPSRKLAERRAWFAEEQSQTGEAAATNTGTPTPTTTGLDGKTYTKPKPAARRRAPLTEAFGDARRKLELDARRLARLADDDRFARNRDDLKVRYVWDLLRACAEVQDVIQKLLGADGDPSLREMCARLDSHLSSHGSTP